MDQLIRYKRFLSHDPGNLNLWLDTVRLAIELHELQQAKELTDSAPAALLENAEANALIGHVLLAHGQYQTALKHLLYASSQGATQAAVIINTAYCQLYLGQPQDSQNTLDSLPELHELQPQAYLVLSARLAHHLNESDKAITLLEQLHEQHDITAESAGLLSLLLFEADRDYDKAMQLANLALQKNPRALEALLARTSLHLDSGDLELALADAATAITKHPENGRAWSNLTLLEFNNFNFPEAKVAAEKAVLYMADHIGTWHILGWSCIILEEYERALWAFEQSYKLDRGFAETHGGLASVYAHQGKTKLAKNHIKLAEKLDPNNFSIDYAKLVLLNNNNETDNAKNLFEEIKGRTNPRLNTTLQELMNKRLATFSKQKSITNTIH